MIIVVVIFLSFLLCAAAYMMIRNFMVYRYRRRIANIVFSYGVDDYMWRLRVYQSVSYDEMMYKFWKPLNSFYPDKSFLKPRKEK